MVFVSAAICALADTAKNTNFPILGRCCERLLPLVGADVFLVRPCNTAYKVTKDSRDSLVEIPGIAICLAQRRNMVLRCFQDGFLGHVHEYLGFLVTDPVDMLRRNYDLLVGIPMAGLHKQVTNRPTLVIHDKTNDEADRSFAGLDGLAAKSLCALQMKIVACSLTRHKMRRRRSLGKTAHAPRFASTIILLFILP